MDKQTVTDEETVSEQVRKEQIEAKGDTKKTPQAPQVEAAVAGASPQAAPSRRPGKQELEG